MPQKAAEYDCSKRFTCKNTRATAITPWSSRSIKYSRRLAKAEGKRKIGIQSKAPAEDQTLSASLDWWGIRESICSGSCKSRFGAVRST